MLCDTCGALAHDSSKFCPSCGSTISKVTDPHDYVGKTIARKYRVETMLGEGGMGRVFRARQVDLDKPVVLKVLRHSLLSDERTVARFKREAKAASRLNHPNSISILDFGQADDGALYIAMEFVAGKDLHTLLSREWPLPEPRVIRIVSQVLSALSDAHAAGVIHRDLKPENIMVEQRRGDPDFVKVLDFGIAKIQDLGGEDGQTLTRQGFVCGTPEYMSPEQARGAALDARSDLYAVGVILYQLMTGSLPFESDSAVGFATKHLTEEPVPPSRRRGDVEISAGLERVIMRTLAKDPKDRPQSAEAFRAELLALLPARDRRLPAPAPAAAAGGNGRRGASALSSLGPPPLSPPGRIATPPEGQRTEAMTQLASWDAEETESSRRGLLGGGRAMLAFKALTLALVAAALVLTAVFLLQLGGQGEVDAFVPPVNAPVPGGAAARPPLYELQIPPNERNPEAAASLVREGDRAFHERDLVAAAAKLREAFQQNPSPELSLKLGWLYFVMGKDVEARGWMDRHLRDNPTSKARPFIERAFAAR